MLITVFVCVHRSHVNFSSVDPGFVETAISNQDIQHIKRKPHFALCITSNLYYILFILGINAENFEPSMEGIGYMVIGVGWIKQGLTSRLGFTEGLL